MPNAVAIRAFGFALLGCLLLSAMPICGEVSAQPASIPQRHSAGERYFIEFRARRSTLVGHTYVVYGRADAAGRILDQRYAGLIPDNRDWRGLFLPIPASVREGKDDARLKPDITYRRPLSAAEYATVSRAVRFLRNNEREWHLIFQNCNDFGIVLAAAVGLRRPPSLMFPIQWVSTLRALNE